MSILTPQTWMARELAYRTGEPVEDIAAREEVLPSTVKRWAVECRWVRFGPPDRILQLRLDMALVQVEDALDADDQAEAAQRLRVLASYVRLKRMAGTLDQTAEQGDAGGDDTQTRDEPSGDGPGDDRSLEDIRRELDAILPRAAEA